MTRTRLAQIGDAEAIARIQVAGWRDAYAHILSAAFLAGLDAAARAEQWRTRLGDRMRPDAPTFVAVDGAGAVMGFSHTGPARDADLEERGRGEIYTVYVDPSGWRRGIGSALMSAVDDFWAATDVTELVLWVFEQNAAGRRFYEALGWRPDGATQTDDFGGARPVELRYRRPLTPSRR